MQAPVPSQLSAEVAAFISQRTLGIIALPDDLDAAVSAAVTQGQSSRSLRKAGKRLVSDLQLRSRSKSRGGTQESSLSQKKQQQQLRTPARQPKPHKVRFRLTVAQLMVAHSLYKLTA